MSQEKRVDREKSTIDEREPVHYVDWSSHRDVRLACDQSMAWAWGVPDAFGVLHTEDRWRYAPRMEDVTCLACHQRVVRAAREEAERGAAESKQRIGRLLSERFEVRRVKALLEAALAAYSTLEFYTPTVGRPWAERIAAKAKEDAEADGEASDPGARLR